MIAATASSSKMAAAFYQFKMGSATLRQHCISDAMRVNAASKQSALLDVAHDPVLALALLRTVADALASAALLSGALTAVFAYCSRFLLHV
jgi:hypothetical protein